MKKYYQWLPLFKNKTIGSILIELLIVITVLVLLASLATPSLFYLKQYNTNVELDKLQIICQLLQKMAVSNNHKEYLTFNTHDNSYFYRNHSEKLDTGVMFGFIQGTKGPPANPKGIINAPVTFPQQKIIFYPNGTISSGTVYLTNQQKNILYALTVPVSQVSFLRKYKYCTGSWLYLK